jgi:hypothetical protein
MDKNDAAPPLSSSLLLDELKRELVEQRDQIDRIAGMSAEALTQMTRLWRIFSAGQSLDGRQKQAFDERMTQLNGALRTFGLLAFDRWTPEDIARRFDKPRIDAARRILKAAEEGSGESMFKRKDDSITLRVTIPTGDGGKKGQKKIVTTIVKALAAAAAGAILRHLAG